MFTIPEDELVIRATRAGGPGGQHVNKTSTRVEVVWDVRASSSLDDEQRAVVLERLAARLDGRGRIRVVEAGSRSQTRNRDVAVARLRKLVRDALRPRKRRVPTKPTVASRERRLDEKRKRGEKKRERQPPADD